MRYVVAVAEERSFTRAPERCLEVQYALNHQTNAVERELGATIFAGPSLSLVITAAG